jgi:hypothetical protein
MDRATVYTQEQGRSTDFLFAQRATMIGLGKLAQAVLGSGTMVRGLPVAPNSPAALNVVVGIGEIYSLTSVDATQWGSLPADTTDLIVKQGLNMAAQTISTPAPTTGGFSVNYLIEAQYQDQDNVPVVLPYFNSANPSQPLTGQNNSGAAQPTERQGVCVIQAKAGIPAATGTQTTPSADSGWTALAVVTVAYGQTTVTSGNISVPAGVPQVTSLVQMMQTESTNYALDTSTTPNQITISLTPPITAYTDGMQLNFRAANNSSGAVNINAGPGNIALSGAAGALQSGEIVAGGYYSAVYQSNSGTAVLCAQGAGAEQINPATQSKHAMQLGQATGRLLNVQVFASSGTYTPSSSLVTSVIVEVQGGGGGSAGSPATTSTQASVGGAGSNGAYAKSRFTSGFSGVAVTVGAGGVAGTVGGPGGNGGASSFGTLTTAGGGFGGNTGGPTTTSTIAGPTSIPTATGGNILQINGGYPAYSFCVATGIIFTIPSPGSPSQMGPSPGPNAAGSGFGVGGGGSGNAASAAASVGYAGTQGKVIVYEYA